MEQGFNEFYLVHVYDSESFCYCDVMCWAEAFVLCLQNPTNKKEIFCDAKLKAIFDGKEKVGFLEIGKLLSRHFVKAG